MNTRSDSLSSAGQGESFDDEQRFSNWMNQRLGLYQTMQQQVQASINQTVQFASDFLQQMEQEAEQMLARYQQQRADQQQARDALVEEMARLQASMLDERRAHEAQLVQTRQQVESVIALQQAQARAEHERILREARAERDRIVAETRQMAERLAVLQRSLTDMLSPVAQEVPAVPLQPVVEVAPLQPVVEAVSSDNGTPPPLAEPVAVEPNTAPSKYQVLIEAVKSFVTASDLIDRLSQLPDVESTRLVQYEQEDLTVALVYHGQVPFSLMLKEQFADVTNFVDDSEQYVRLVYRP